MVFVVYLFFSIAATKMLTFTIVVSMIIFIAFAILIDYLLVFIGNILKKQILKSALFVISLLIIVLLRFNIEMLQEKHTLWKKDNLYSRILSHNKKIFQSLELPSNTVLFNVKGRHYIEAMFYTGLPAYNFIPTFDQYKDLKLKGRKIAIFNSAQLNIPDYLEKDTDCVLINQELQGYE